MIFSTSIILDNLKHARSLNNEHFNSIVKQTEDSILKKYALYEAYLIGGLGLFNASNYVDSLEWGRYVETLNIKENLPGIGGLGFIDYVQKEKLESYIETVRENRYSDFANYPKTNFNDKFIIRHIAPIKANKVALGLDIGFESNRRLAAEKSRDTGLPTITRKVDLVQDKKNLAGFLLLIPFYNNNRSINSDLSEKRASISGWIFAPFVAPDFFSSLDYQDSRHLHYEVYDGANIISDSLIYKSNTPTSQNNSISKVTHLDIAGNVWTEVYPMIRTVS